MLIHPLHGVVEDDATVPFPALLRQSFLGQTQARPNSADATPWMGAGERSSAVALSLSLDDQLTTTSSSMGSRSLAWAKRNREIADVFRRSTMDRCIWRAIELSFAIKAAIEPK